MDRILKPHLKQINNVALGSPWTSDFDIGPAYRYTDILVTMTPAAGLTCAAVTDFIDLTTLFANSKPFRTFLGIEAHSIYNRFGSNYGALIFKSQGAGNTLQPFLTNGALTAPAAATQTTCAFRVYYEEAWRKNWSAAASRKFYTTYKPAKAGGPNQSLSSFQIQSLIPNTANNAAATNLSVIMYHGTDGSLGPVDANGNPVTTCLSWQRYPGLSYTAAGDQQIQNVVKYAKGTALGILEQLTIFSQSTGDDLNRIQVNADGRIVYDCTSAETALELIRHGFNPSALSLDQFEYVADANDVITDGLYLSTANGAFIGNLNITGTLTAAAGGNKTLVTIAQIYKPLD